MNTISKILLSIIVLGIILTGFALTLLPLRQVSSDLALEFSVPRSYQHVRLKLASGNALEEILTSNNGTLIHLSKDKNDIKFDRGLQVNMKTTYCVEIADPNLGPQRLVYVQNAFSEKNATVVSSQLINSSGPIKAHWIEIQIIPVDKESTIIKIRSWLTISRRCPNLYLQYFTDKVNEGNQKNINNMQSTLTRIADQNLLNFKMGNNQIDIAPPKNNTPADNRRFPFLKR